MPEAVAATSAVAVGWLLTYLLHSTVLIGGAWALTRVVTLQPGTRDFLWRLALLGGIVTASGVVWSTPTSLELDIVRQSGLGPSLHEVRGAAAVWTALESEEIVLRAEPRVLRADATAPSPECRALLRRGSPRTPGWIQQVDELCARSVRLRWYHGLILIWIVGAGIGLTALARSQRALSDLRASLVEAGPRPRALLDELGGGFGSVSVMSSSVLAAPCVLPGRTIGLPNRCEEELTDGELRAVLAHEVAHVLRGDHSRSGFFRVVMALLWVQPLNRIALRGALEAAELTCDDWALARTGERYGLASSISRVAEWASSAVQHTAVVSMVGRDGGTVSCRVRRILLGTRRDEPFWIRGLTAAVIVVPLLWLPPVPAPSTRHAAIIIEQQEIERLPDVGSAEPGVAERRVFIASIRGG